MSADKTVRRKPARAFAPRGGPATEAASGDEPRAPALARVVATRLEEEIVLGRRHPRERLIEQDLCDRFDTHRGDVSKISSCRLMTNVGC